jgi:16S rRNA processing protein RimM
MADYLLLGYVIDSFSLDGTFKVLSKTDFAKKRYQKGNTVFLYSAKTNERKALTVAKYRSNGQFDFVKFEEINNPEEAASYKGYELQVEKDYKNMEKDTYYFDDLVGCKVVDDNDQELGVVSLVEEFPAQLTLRVKRKDKEDFLVPFVKAFIKSVDIINKKIVINVIGGLL